MAEGIFRAGGSPPVTLVLHGVGNLDETSNVGTHDEGRKRTLVGLGGVGDRGLVAVFEAVDHDVLQLLVDLLGGPGLSLGVLGHLQAGDGDTTAVGGLTWGVPDGGAEGGGRLSLGLEDVDGLLGGAHVGALGDELAAGGNQSLGLLTGDLVLGGRRQGDVDGADVDPRSLAWQVLALGGLGGERLVGGNDLLQGLELELGGLDGVDLLRRDTLLVDDGARGVRERHDGGAQLDGLQGSVLGNVTGPGDGDPLTGKGLLAVGGLFDHLLDVVDKTVPGGFWSDQGAAPGQALTGEDTFPLVLHLLVGAEHEADLSATGTDVTGRHVCELTDVSGQLSHECDTESSDLVVGLALRVEVGATLTTAHWEAGQSVLEDLLVPQELEDREVHRGVQSQPALVWAQG